MTASGLGSRPGWCDQARISNLSAGTRRLKWSESARGSGLSNGARFVKGQIAKDALAWPRVILANLLYHWVTESVTGGLTLLNFLLIIIDADCQAAGREVSTPVKVLNWLCFGIFVLEFVIRIYVERWMVLHSAIGWLDAVVVVFGTIGEFLEMVNIDFSLLRVFRIIRLGRLTKAFAMFQSLRELRKLLRSLVGVMRTLLWSAILLFFAMTIWAVIAVILIHPLMQTVSAASEWEACPRCVRSFASVNAANLTFLQTSVLGDEWGLIAIPVIEEHPWTILIFGGSLITLGLGMLNLAVAIMVDAAAEARAQDDVVSGDSRLFTERLERKRLEVLFNVMDSDSSGTITVEELRNGADSIPDFCNRLRALDITGEDLADLFEMMDENKSGEIEMDEFIGTLYRMKCGNQGSAMSLVRQYVTRMKKDQDGLSEQVLRVQEALGKMTDHIKEEIYNEFSSESRPVTPRIEGELHAPKHTTEGEECIDDFLVPAVTQAAPTFRARSRKVAVKLEALRRWTDIWQNLIGHEEGDQLLLDEGDQPCVEDGGDMYPQKEECADQFPSLSRNSSCGCDVFVFSSPPSQPPCHALLDHGGLSGGIVCGNKLRGPTALGDKGAEHCTEGEVSLTLPEYSSVSHLATSSSGSSPNAQLGESVWAAASTRLRARQFMSEICTSQTLAPCPSLHKQDALAFTSDE